MEKHTYHNLGLIGLSKYVAELLLVSEGSIEWVKEKRVLVIWHAIFFSLITIIISSSVVKGLFEDALKNSAELTDIYRLCLVIFYCLLLVLFIVFAFRYYKYLLLTSKDLRMQSIVLFALGFLIIFSQLYLSLYYLEPGLYKYADPILVPSVFGVGSFIEKYTLLGDFILYSASVATNIDYPRIESVSSIISIVNVIQSLVSIFLIALVISTFVQKAGQK